jgi:hypothetical protein
MSRPRDSLSSQSVDLASSEGYPESLPEYEDIFREVNISQEDFHARAELLRNFTTTTLRSLKTNIFSDDGRVNINISDKQRRLSNIFAPALTNRIHQLDEKQSKFGRGPSIPPNLDTSGEWEWGRAPSLNVVIQVVGSRGDVQPFIALGKVLKKSHNHRVRVATHAVFQKLVEENGLEFFNSGGNPLVLMAFMVKNPGLFPTMDSIKSGDIGKNRNQIFEILNGCWMSCYQAGNNVVTGSDFRKSFDKEFVADAIIANPPSFAHIHCAQKLGVPLHLMFT